MNKVRIEAFLAALGIHHSKDSGNWVQAQCPMHWNHQGGKDTHPSFGIRIVEGHPSYYNCYVCGGGSLKHLIEEVAAHDDVWVSDQMLQSAAAILDGEELSLIPLEDFESGMNSNAPLFCQWPEWFLESFMPAKYSVIASDYLTGRGVQPWIRDKFDLRYDTTRSMIVTPYRDMEGRLAGMRGRSIDPNCPKELRHYDYTWNGVNNSRLVWLNEPCLKFCKPTVVVEGQFDLINVCQITEDVVAGLTAKNTPHKLAKLTQCERVIFMPDQDGPGLAAAQKNAEWLTSVGGMKPHMVTVLNYQFKDPGEMPLEELKHLLGPLGFPL